MMSYVQSPAALKGLDDRNDALELPKIHRVPRYISAEHRSNEIGGLTATCSITRLVLVMPPPGVEPGSTA